MKMNTFIGLATLTAAAEAWWGSDSAPHTPHRPEPASHTPEYTWRGFGAESVGSQPRGPSNTWLVSRDESGIESYCSGTHIAGQPMPIIKLDAAQKLPPHGWDQFVPCIKELHALLTEPTQEGVCRNMYSITRTFEKGGQCRCPKFFDYYGSWGTQNLFNADDGEYSLQPAQYYGAFWKCLINDVSCRLADTAACHNSPELGLVKKSLTTCSAVEDALAMCNSNAFGEVFGRQFDDL